jgi:hypothetical protein
MDYNLIFHFENVTANNLIFSELDLNLDYNFTPNFTEDFNFYQINFDNDSFISIDNSSIIDKISIFDSNIVLKDAVGFHILSENIDLNFSTTNFFVKKASDSNRLTNFIAMDVNTITIYDLNIYSEGLFSFGDFDYFNIFDSNIISEDSYFYIGFYNTGNMDLNLSGTNLLMGAVEDSNENTFMYLLAMDLNNLEISNLNISTDVNFYNFLQLGYSNINNLLITDSNIQISNFLWGSDFNLSGVIYNNYFWDFNLDLNYIDLNNSNVILDFNYILEENSVKRDFWSDNYPFEDNSDYIGGNIWLDENLDFICVVDNLNPKGICDNSIEILGNIDSYFDYYPLIAVVNAPDLNVYSYSIISSDENNYLTLGDTLDINFYFTNSGTLDINDVNGLLYVGLLDYEGNNIFLADSFSSLITLNVGDYNYFSMGTIIEDIDFNSENGLVPGLYDINFILFKDGEFCDFTTDENCLNNYLFIENAFGIYEDNNYIIEVYSLDTNQDYPGQVEFDCNIINLGSQASNRDYNVIFLYDYNGEEYNGYYITEFSDLNVIDPFEIQTVSFTHLVETAGTYRFACMVQDDRYIDEDQVQYYIEKEFVSINNTPISTDLFECQDLNEDYLNTTLYLANDFNLDLNQYCFTLDFLDYNAGLNSYIEIDCNGYDLNSIFNSSYFLRLLDPVDEIILKNCNTYNSNLFYLESDVNSINLLDSNIFYLPDENHFIDSELFISNYYHNNLDLNFSGSLLNISTIWEADTKVFDFNFGLNNLNIYNLDANLHEAITLFNINNYLEHISVYDTNIEILDIDYLFNIENVTNSLDLNLDVFNSYFYTVGDSESFSIYVLQDSNFKDIFVNSFFDFNLYPSWKITEFTIFVDNNTYFDNLYFYDVNIPNGGSEYNNTSSPILFLSLFNLENKDLNIFLTDCDFNTNFYFIKGSNLFDINLFFNNLNYDNELSFEFGTIDLDIYLSDSNLNLYGDYLYDANINFYGNNSTLDFSSRYYNYGNHTINLGLYDFNLITSRIFYSQYGSNGSVSVIDCNVFSTDYDLFTFLDSVNYDLNFYGTQFVEYIDFLVLNAYTFGNKLFNIYNLNFSSESSGLISSYNSNQSNILNFYDSNINIRNSLIDDYEDSNNVFYLSFNNTDVNYLLLRDLNYLDLNRSILDLNNNSNVNYIIFENLIVNSNSSFDNLFNFENINDNFIDINFYNSIINLNDTNNLFYIEDSNINELNIYDFNNSYTNNSNNGLVLNDSNIFNLNIQDSIFYLDSVAYVDVNSNLSALIYNNIFYDYNYDNAFVFNYGITNIDFNNNLEDNNLKREQIISDDYNLIGGNLWLDSLGNYLCAYDYNEDGICDNNKSILFSDLSYVYDYYPLVEDSLDLNVYDISLNSNNAGTITVTCRYGNIGNLIAKDYGVAFYVNNILQSTTNWPTTEILPKDVNSTTFSWTASAGTYSLKCVISSSLSDINSINNTRTESFTISGNDGPGGPTEKIYDLSSNFTTSNTNLSKTSNIVLTPSISKSGTATFGSAEYVFYFYNDSNTKIELFSNSFSDSSLPLTNTHTLTLDNLLIYGDILDLVDSQGKIKLYLEVIASNDSSLTNNISTKTITIQYFEASLNELYLNDSLLSEDINFNLEEDYILRFGFEYLAINTSKSLSFNLRSNKRLLVSKQVNIQNSIDENYFEDTLNLNLLDFVSESDAKKLILNVYGFDLNNSIHRAKYIEVLTNLGISLDGLSFAENNYYLEIGLSGQDYSNNPNTKLNLSFYSDIKYDDEPVIPDTENPENQKNDSEKVEIIKYFLKYKSIIGIDENQIIFIYDDKNNFISNIDVIIKFNEELFFFKTDSKGQLVYSPNNDGNYDITIKQLGLKGRFEVLFDYKSSDKDYIVFESDLVFGESKKTNYIYYLVPIIFVIILIVIGIFFFYPKKKDNSYDFTLSDNYLKSEYFEKDQLEKDIKIAKREETLVEKEVVKKELKFAYKEDKALERKLKEKTGYDL